MKLTELEKQILYNIANSEYMSADKFDNMVDFPVWSFSVTNSTNQLKGALGSCVKKGLVNCEIEDEDETCWMTKEGVQALKEICND